MSRPHKAGAVIFALCFPFFGTMVAMNEARHSPATARIQAEVRYGKLAALTPGCHVHDWGCVLAAAHKQKGR